MTFEAFAQSDEKISLDQPKRQRQRHSDKEPSEILVTLWPANKEWHWPVFAIIKYWLLQNPNHIIKHCKNCECLWDLWDLRDPWEVPLLTNIVLIFLVDFTLFVIDLHQNAHFTVFGTISRLSLSSDSGTRSCTHSDTASYQLNCILICIYIFIIIFIFVCICILCLYLYLYIVFAFVFLLLILAAFSPQSFSMVKLNWTFESELK